jgi:glycosyltransferase involved in cell wall biosynthesis
MNGTAVELGALNAQQMTEELAMSHVFISPSFIDNSPNAVSEAQLMGMPVISTYTGGVPSLIEEGQTGLFFQTADAPMLAARLREIFENDELTVRIGSRAREIAVKRHDPDMIVKQVLSNYDAVLKYY